MRKALSWVEKDPERLLDEFHELAPSEQLDLILFTSGDLRQELISCSPYAEELVARLPDEEIYITLKEIGLSHAAPLLALMTPDQDRFLADMELWKKDSFEADRLMKLLELLLPCGEDRLARWLEAVDSELLALTLSRHGRVSKLDPFRDSAETSEETHFISPDGYYRFHPAIQEIRPIIEPVLRILHTRDPQRYGMILESAEQDQSADVVLEALLWRESRLSEKGFAAFEEAVEIYRPLSAEDFQRLVREVPPERPERGQRAAILYPVLWLSGDSLFQKAFRAAAASDHRERIQAELAQLGNKVLVADGLDIGDSGALKPSLDKVAGYLTIGLQRLAGADADEAASWICRSWLHFLFRLGYSQVLTLAQRARGIRPATRFPWMDRYHYLPDSPLEETLRGLLKPRPLLAVEPDPEKTRDFREFASLEDIHGADRLLACLETLADLFSDGLGLAPERIKAVCIEGGMGDRLDAVKWSLVLNTIWANKLVADRWEFQPLLPGQARRFLEVAFTGRGPGRAGKVRSEAARDLVRWVDGRLATREKSARAAAEACILRGIERLEQELGGLAEDTPIDGRFVQCLWVRTIP